MSLIERAVSLMEEAGDIKEEFEEVVDLETRRKSVHISFYDGLNENLDRFLDLADGRMIDFIDRGDSDYPFEAYFEVDEVTFFVMLEDGQKEELERLIVEKQTHDFIESLEEL